MTKRNEGPWERQWCLKESFQNEIAFVKVVRELFSNFKSVVSGKSILNFILIYTESFIKLTSQNNVLVNAWIEFDGLINAYKLSTAVLLFRNSLEVRSIFVHGLNEWVSYIVQ